MLMKDSHPHSVPLFQHLLLLTLLGIRPTLSLPPATPLIGAGASFPGDVYSDWLPSYAYGRQAEGSRVSANYHVYNSGSGKSAMFFTPPAIQFGASDIELSPAEQTLHRDIRTIPMIAGCVSTPKLRCSKLRSAWNRAFIYQSDWMNSLFTNSLVARSLICSLAHSPTR